MATSGLKTLANLVPLIKLDGYYLLSDYLEVANLRRNVFADIGRRLKWQCRADGAVEPQITSRERRNYLTYVDTIA